MCQHSLPHCQRSYIFEKGHVFEPGKRCCIFSAAANARRYVVPRCSHRRILFFLAFKYVRIWWRSVMAAGCVCQHCRAKHYNGFCSAHRYVWPGAVVGEQHLTTLLLWGKLYMQASIQTSACCNIAAEFYYCSLGKKFIISVLFSSQKTVAKNREEICSFFHLGGIVWRHYVDCHLNSGSEFEPSFQPLWQLSIGRPFLHCHISAKVQWKMISFPLCMHQSAFVVHQEHVNCNSQALEWMIPGFRREVGEKCPLLVYYSASSGNYQLFIGFLNLEDGANRLSRNVGKKVQLLAA